MSAGELLNEKQKRFAQAYYDSKNATEAYRYAYPESNVNSAKTSGSRLLTDDNVRDYLAELENQEKAFTAIVNGENKRRLAIIIREFHVFSIRMVTALKTKAPQGDEAIHKTTATELRALAQAGNLIGQNLVNMNELQNQVTGAAAIGEEILERIKQDKWYVQNKDELEADESESDDLCDRG
jgi:hypothetical protein